METGLGEEGLDVVVFDLGIDVYVVGVEDGGVVERFQNGLFEGVGEEGIFIWGLEAPDPGIEAFARVEKPVEEGEGAVGGDGWEWERGGYVDCGVEGELDALD